MTIQQLNDHIAEQEKLQAQYAHMLKQRLEEYPNLNSKMALPIQPEERIKSLQKELKHLLDEQQKPKKRRNSRTLSYSS